MPFMQAIATRANAELTRAKLKQLKQSNIATFAQPGSLLSALQSLGIVSNNTDEIAYIDDFPSGLKEAVRAVLTDNLNAPGEPLDVTVAWAPGYDDEVKFFQVADNERSHGGITILVKSRFPNDRRGKGTGVNG